MKSTLPNPLKKVWFRRISVLAALFFLWNTNLAFCACLAGEPMAAHESGKPVQEKACHCSHPGLDTAQHPTGSSAPQADTCPLCHCVFTENSAHPSQNVAPSSGVQSTWAVAAAAEQYLALDIYQERRFGADPPLRFVRLQALYLLHSSFLN